MIMFVDRKAIAKEYRKWLRQNNALDCAENLLAFLCVKNLMDLDATEKYVEAIYDVHNSMLDV